MEYFVKEALIYDGDNVGIATSFVIMLKTIAKFIPNLKVKSDSYFSFLPQINQMMHINLSKLVPYTSYYELSESIRALYRLTDPEIQKYLNGTFKCPKCGQITEQFGFYIQIFNTIQITVNINDCDACTIPLDLIQPPTFIIIYRAISEMQQNYQDIKDIPQKINYFTEDIIYDLHHVTTNDVVNDLYQNIIRDSSQKIYFNQNFEYNADRYDLQEELSYICRLNPYSSLLTVPNPTKDFYNYIKKDEMQKYLYDCSYGPIQRMVGKTELIFYELRSMKKYIKFDNPNNIIDQEFAFQSPQQGIQTLQQQQIPPLMLSVKDQNAIMEKQQQIMDQLHQNKFNIPVNNVPVNTRENQLYMHLTDNQLLRYRSKQQDLIRSCHCEQIYTPDYKDAKEKLNKASLALQRKKIKYRGWQ